MLKIALCAALLFLLCLENEAAASTSCSTDRDCRTDECCIEYFPYYKRCKDKPDDPGDVCLGQFNCDCKAGLVCVPHSPSIYNRIKIGAGVCGTK